MPIGSHNDAFKAYQSVKKLAGKSANPVLARLTADILLDFVKNIRQINPTFMLDNLPDDSTPYESQKLDNALESVESLCGKCRENHDNACFVNQSRRILIFAKTGADLGSQFDGAKSLAQLLEDAFSCGSSDKKICHDSQDNSCEEKVTPEAYAELKRKYEELRDKDVFRGTLIDEIVDTIKSVSEGNLEAEMPVHDDHQLGNLATAFNIMLKTINRSMSHLDHLVAERVADLNLANQKLHESLGKLQKEITERERLEESLRETNEKIMESIHYAKMIQNALLPNLDKIKTYLPDSFFLWMPRDVVGGDIFFAESVEDGFVIAVIDCTGHGVPGAFLTMIAYTGLRRIIISEECYDPAQILKRLNTIVKKTLRQDTEDTLSDDGLDAAIVRVQLSVNSEQKMNNVITDNCSLITDELTFAGAKLPLLIVHNGEVQIIKGDRQSLGYKRSDLDFNFTTHTVAVEKGMSFYMYSDGFADQMGGHADRRFGSTQFKELLKGVAVKPFDEQRNMLVEAFEAYRGENEIQDDVTVVGFGF